MRFSNTSNLYTEIYTELRQTTMFIVFSGNVGFLLMCSLNCFLGVVGRSRQGNERHVEDTVERLYYG